MKKILLAFLIGTTTLALSTGCTKEYITNVLPGISYTTTVAAGDWDVDSFGIYFVNLDFPELDNTYYEYGTVQVAIELNGVGGGYRILPATIGDYHYSVDYAVGSVQIFAENRDGTTVAPPAVTAKITLTDADNGGN